MNDGKSPAASIQPTGTTDAAMDEGRRYWKAAIAHLAPEKREAAWDFYLDRLESSAAADTLGGVMLLLEAHLAFFDDFPARLGQAAQQIESVLRTTGQVADGRATPSTAFASAPAPAPRRRWRAFLMAGVSATLGGFAVFAAFSIHRHPAQPAPTNAPTQAGYLIPTGLNLIRVDAWIDPTTHRQQGAIISLRSVAWTEQTVDGGARIYVTSPIEEVRRDLEALRRASK